MLKSTDKKYGVIALVIHWASAFIILLMLVSGFRAGGMDDAVDKAAILRVHIPAGIVILLLTLARIAWWLFADIKPASVPMPAWQDHASKAVHILFYIGILGMAASGIGMMLLSGAGPQIFDGSTAALPNFWDYKPRVPHGIGGRALAVLFIVHVGAALYHHFILRDALLRRMWFGPRSK